MIEIYRTHEYINKFEDVEYYIEVRQCEHRNGEKVVFEYEVEDGRFLRVETIWMKYWFPKIIRKLIYRSVERKFCKTISKYIGRELIYMSSIK